MTLTHATPLMPRRIATTRGSGRTARTVASASWQRGLHTSVLAKIQHCPHQRQRAREVFTVSVIARRRPGTVRRIEPLGRRSEGRTGPPCSPASRGGNTYTSRFASLSVMIKLSTCVALGRRRWRAWTNSASPVRRRSSLSSGLPRHVGRWANQPTTRTPAAPRPGSGNRRPRGETRWVAAMSRLDQPPHASPVRG